MKRNLQEQPRDIFADISALREQVQQAIADIPGFRNNLPANGKSLEKLRTDIISLTNALNELYTEASKVDKPAVEENNEYDIIRSGNFKTETAKIIGMHIANMAVKDPTHRVTFGELASLLKIPNQKIEEHITNLEVGLSRLGLFLETSNSELNNVKIRVYRIRKLTPEELAAPAPKPAATARRADPATKPAPAPKPAATARRADPTTKPAAIYSGLFTSLGDQTLEQNKSLFENSILREQKIYKVNKPYAIHDLYLVVVPESDTQYREISTGFGELKKGEVIVLTFDKNFKPKARSKVKGADLILIYEPPTPPAPDKQGKN